MEPIICDWNSFYQIFENFDLQQQSKNWKKQRDYRFQRLNFSVRSRFIGRHRLLDMTSPFNWDLGQTVFYQHFISSQSSAEYQAPRSGLGFRSHAGMDEEQAHQSQGSGRIRMWLNQVLCSERLISRDDRENLYLEWPQTNRQFHCTLQ